MSPEDENKYKKIELRYKTRGIESAFCLTYTVACY